MPEVETLEDLYGQMYALTHGHCGCEGTGQHGCGCCASFHCLRAQEFAREHYGIELQPTGHPVMFMGDNGCTVAPYLRPICTLHACHISYASSSQFPDDPERTAAYFELRDRLLATARQQGKYPFLPKGASPMILSADQGTILAIVHQDGTIDVWTVPMNATITVQPAKGFGGIAETAVAATLADAELDIDVELKKFRAL